MKRRHFSYLFVSLLIVSFAGYLVQTGERGFGQQTQPARPLDVTRLSKTDTERLGWKAQGLDAVFADVATLSTDTLMIVTDGKVVGAFGDLSKPYNVHSIRKSVLSALVGRHWGSVANEIRLETTLQELSLDDAPIPLTTMQKKTTVRDLLMSRSGINHPAAASGSLQEEIDRRLGNKENEPGTIWAYNNWDYNALTTVFENETGIGIAEAFETGIARPISMDDFDAGSVSYISNTRLSVHKAAMFKMSARDLARFGQLYLDSGRFDGQQILPGAWIDKISSDFTVTGMEGLRWGHGYLWWIPGPNTGLPEGSFWAWGLGNQALIVIPEWDTVIVHQSDTTEFWSRFLPMIRDDGMTGEAAVEKLILSCREAVTRETEFCIDHRLITRREFDRLLSLIAAARVQPS
ncbi:serine hydrolase domain-containing protein [Roseibium alexandrii]|uniref:Beta-lactamase n=1 Tax=Roseibium alexandrii TaxID=388408 RepID=A0A0M6ZWC9_9HYPH|nr:serine hydrolase [Roseibium alexandrii]CTQ67058.1 Beta-lactamase [Roseibium alexandrii]